MHDLFTELVVLTIVTSVLVYFTSRLGQSIIIGYILSGVLLGPFGFGAISDPNQIKLLSEIGIILLMFTVGIEFSLEKPLGFDRRTVLIGLAQILFSVAAGVLAGHWLGFAPEQSVFIGCVMALSSTAIVLKFLADRGELDTLHGKIGVGILIVQDLAVIPMMFFLPVASRIGSLDPMLLVQTAGKAVLFIGGLFAYGRWILPRILDAIAHVQYRETLVVATLGHCFGVTWLAGQFGISLPLGAFLAGITLVFTPYAHQAVANIIPFRDGFVGLFFISIGMLLNPEFIFGAWQMIGSVTVGIILVKTAIITLIVLAFGLPFRIAFPAGLMLSQIGEFSFLLTHTGLELGIIGKQTHQVIITSTVATMLVTPTLIRFAPRISHRVERALRLERFGRIKIRKDIRAVRLPSRNHVILCGFGPIGQNLATILERDNIPYCVMDLNPTTVRDARRKKVPIFYADAFSPEALRHAGILHARALVITFPDPIGITRLVRSIRSFNSSLTLITRTRFDREAPKLYELGVDIVVIEELEASIELAQLLLKTLKVSKENMARDLKFIRDRKEAAISKAILEAEGPNEEN